MFLEDLREKERRMRSVINQSIRGDPNLLENPKLFVRIVVSLDNFIRSAKMKREEKKIDSYYEFENKDGHLL